MVEDGQPDSADIHKQNGGNPLTGPMQPSHFTVGLESATEHVLAWRIRTFLQKENTVADQKSRAMRDRCDWMLNSHVFNHIQSLMGPLETDLFASRLAKQLLRFFSWRPDPEVERTNAFSQNWLIARCYANSPWCLIPYCLSQARQQMARMVIITILWNSQPWFPTILGLLEDFPRLLPARANLVIFPTDQEFIMKQGVSELVTRPISGNPSHHKEFPQRLQTSSYPPGELRPSWTITHCLPNG